MNRERVKRGEREKRRRKDEEEEPEEREFTEREGYGRSWAKDNNYVLEFSPSFFLY